MNEENINGSAAIAASPVPKKPVRKHTERRVRLTDSFIRKLRPKDKPYSYGDSEVPGLRIYIEVSGTKTFYYAYKPENKKDWVRIKIGSFAILNVPQARNKAQHYATAILDGKDPVIAKRELKAENTLGELIKQFYKNRFNSNYGYKPNTIKVVKICFNAWVFKKSFDPGVLKVQEENPYSIQHKKLSQITKEDMKGLHNTIRIKAPFVANKVLKFLNVVFKYGVEIGELLKNPIKMKKKEWVRDKEDNRVLTENQRKTLLSIVLKTDGRNGRINYNYYKDKGLNLVACLIITWWLLTGRRNVSEGNKIKWGQISFYLKKITLEDSKVGPRTYNIGPRALKLLQTIKDERLTEGPLFWKEGTKDYVFPSYQFGKKSSRGEKCTKPYFASIRRTWARVLKMANIEYIPPKQCRHTFLTLLLDKSKNIMVVKKAAGHTNVKTTERYAKILDKEVVSGLEKMDQVEETESKVLEFKK